ncbi:MAG: hypothetical protein TR69_WS6001001094 [candidate division WS6 bacterium OLB20]|uniref:Uncharacterized protein n=1 Tax=candidate division WS6 bacterium OLB20 TaxID=1617426 RepID=A0A136LZI6_9BACT|nr:MAG: hypothetical protein TR69_WS6001001094 [candidate division WS6 bacterium OLB20]
MRENEVVTIDAQHGEVLLGAGKKPDDEVKGVEQTEEQPSLVDPFPVISEADIITKEKRRA